MTTTSAPRTRRRHHRVAGLRAGPQLNVIESKFHAPALRSGGVSRRALVDRLSSSIDPVVAVIAPAGYGKTTLLCEWDHLDRRAVVWLSLDDGDNDPVVLLTHLAVALDRIEGLDPLVFSALASRDPRVPSTVLPLLASALAAMARPVVLLLDDVDSVTEKVCVDVLAELARRLPADSQMVVTSRSVPALPLARWRANGALAEVGASDLALGVAQARLVLRTAGLDVPDEAADDLARSAEGWPAGLRLAALSLSANGDVESPGFTGSDWFVADYFRSEVLARLPSDLVTFVTRTAVLDRMCGSLCDAVLQRPRSAQRLASIENSNLFLVALDHRREWYRYHALFRDALVTELTRREPELMPVLHRRAADWFERNGMLHDALHHAWAAGDESRSALLLERLTQPVDRTSRLETLQAWLDRFDDDVTERHPSLAALAGWADALTGDAIGAAWWAERAGRGLSVEDPLDSRPSSVSTVHLLRALTCRQGVPNMRVDAETAVRLEHVSSPWRAAALTLYGVGTLLAGDSDEADAILADAVETGERIGAFSWCSVALAERSALAMGRGDWTAAQALTGRARGAVKGGGLEADLLSSLVFAQTARMALRRGDVRLAKKELAHAHRLRPLLTRAVPWLASQTLTELARVQLALDDRSAAWALLADAREITTRLPDLGILGDQLADLERTLSHLRGGELPGATTLTSAELRLLSYLPTHLSFREIADNFHLSHNTIKSQAISIYRKLGVSDRTSAVRRARDIGLLDH